MTYETAFITAKESTAAGVPAVPIRDRSRGGGWRTARVPFATRMNWQREYSAKADETAVQEIRARYALGNVSLADLAGTYSLSVMGIHNIVKRKYWKDVR
jgi:hypothetical protein